ncbi:MAG: acetylglutamate kinase [Fusobacteriaceae bacterium]
MKTYVIKYGGSAIGNPEVRQTILEDIAAIKKSGDRIVLVHGGGPEINSMLKKLEIKSEFINGLRVTDSATMEIVEMVLSGKVNKQIVGDLQKLGLKAVGISGRDGKTFHVKKILNSGNNLENDLGFVGEIEKIDDQLLTQLLEQNFIPVVSPVGEINGESYNINADYAAVAVAGAVKADELIFLTDVKGIMLDVSNPDSLMAKVSVSEIQKFIEEKIISGGMIPKVECCVAGVNMNIKNVRIIDGRVSHCLNRSQLDNFKTGTLIYKD